MRQYLDLLDLIVNEGTTKSDRTGVGTISIFGHQSRYNLSRGFPLLTTKKLHTKSIFHELLWFIQGDTNTKYLTSNGVSIWNEWSDANGDIGPVYGKQWRAWECPGGRQIDQLQEAIDTIKKNPDSRRIIVTAWNPADTEKMALPSCHCFYQIYVANGRLSLQMYQRSCDVFLGVPFNIASYALLTMMLAQVTGLQPGEFIHTLGDAHVYLSHLEQVTTQLARVPSALPKLTLDPTIKDINDFRFEHIHLTDYHAQASIAAKVAV